MDLEPLELRRIKTDLTMYFEIYITLNVVRMEREFDAYKLSRCMCQSMFNSFLVIRTASAKNRRFHVPQPTFLFPHVLHRWKDNSMLAKSLAVYTYLSSIVSELYDA